MIWNLSQAGAQAATQLVRNVADWNKPGHEYLEETGAIQIIVAKGEYGEGIFRT